METIFQEIKVEYALDNQVIIVTMNRPPVNAINQATCEDIIKLTSMVEDNENIRVAILRSEGNVFSGGAEIKNPGSPEIEMVIKRRETYRKASAKLYNFPVPLITVIQGGAAGAGAVFSACGDIILASEKAFFSLPEVDVGLVGGAKGIWRMLPPQKVRLMALTGERVPAKEAHLLGGVHKLVPTEELMDLAHRYAKTIAAKGSKASRKWKQALTLTEKLGPVEGLLIEMGLGQELTEVNRK